MFVDPVGFLLQIHEFWQVQLQLVVTSGLYCMQCTGSMTSECYQWPLGVSDLPQPPVSSVFGVFSRLYFLFPPVFQPCTYPQFVSVGSYQCIFSVLMYQSVSTIIYVFFCYYLFSEVHVGYLCYLLNCALFSVFLCALHFNSSILSFF